MTVAEQNLWRKYGKRELQKLASMILGRSGTSRQTANSRGSWGIGVSNPPAFPGYGAPAAQLGRPSVSEKDLIGHIQNMLRKNDFIIRVFFIGDQIVDIEIHG